MIQWIMTWVNRVCCPWIIVANCSLRLQSWTPDETDGCSVEARGGGRGDNGSSGANIDRNKYIGRGRQSKRQPGFNLSRSCKAAFFQSAVTPCCRSFIESSRVPTLLRVTFRLNIRYGVYVCIYVFAPML